MVNLRNSCLALRSCFFSASLIFCHFCVFYNMHQYFEKSGRREERNELIKVSSKRRSACPVVPGGFNTIPRVSLTFASFFFSSAENMSECHSTRTKGKCLGSGTSNILSYSIDRPSREHDVAKREEEKKTYKQERNVDENHIASTRLPRPASRPSASP